MYRFYRIYDNQKWYCQGRGVYCQNTKMAGRFTWGDWLEWGQRDGLEYEEVSEAEKMRVANEPMLPGLEV